MKYFGVKAMQEELCIRYYRHPKHTNLVLFVSHPTNSPKQSAIVQECASGLLLDEADQWNVVAMGHRTIFQYDDKDLTPPIDWSTAQVTEKIGL